MLPILAKKFSIIVVFIALFSICLGNSTFFYCSAKGNLITKYACNHFQSVDKSENSCCSKENKKQSIDCCKNFALKHTAIVNKWELPQSDAKYFDSMLLNLFFGKANDRIYKKLHPVPFASQYPPPLPINLLINKMQC